jgi:dynein light intermediate chain 2
MSKPEEAPRPAERTEDAPPEKPQPKIDTAKDLWQNIAANVKDFVVESSDQTVLVCGASNSGKTSIIQRMLKSAADERPKATVALEYCYGKREERNVTQIVHFWELAQDSALAPLADVVITAENVHQAMAIIVVDCANPNTMWTTLTFWLKRLDSRVTEIFEKMRAKGSTTPDKLLQRAKKRIGDEHPDLNRLRVLGIPVVIVASRLDRKENDTVKTKLMVRTLRFLAHLYGASLIFTSQQEREAAKMRALLNHYIFEVPLDLKLMQLDSDKGGVLVPTGQDTFEDIGDPVPSSSSYQQTGDATLDRWKAPFDEAFPPKAAEKSRDDEFTAKLYDAEKGYGEVAVDQLRKLKDSELDQYRRSAAKKASDARAGKDE